MTPIQRDTLRKQAEREQGQAIAPALQPLDRAMRYKLGADRARLKKIASMQRKAEVKAELLPDYLPYLEGMMAVGRGDEVLTQVMIWAFDAEQMDVFDRLARYALDNGIAMPTEFARPLGSWLAESVAKWTLRQIEAPTASPNAVALNPFALWLDEQTAHMDMHDEVRAKLKRVCGDLLANSHPAAALDYFEEAIRLDPHIRIKKRMTALREQLATTESPTSQGQAAAGATVNVTTTPPRPLQFDPSLAVLMEH
ncbi:Phage small terminase subunit [Thiothrix eikelboomii]|uniref:Phage small terminase subunit n=1 Tax=Thiothrix eikelboomii TaxID=92487 RepID=A0A1T4WUZ7_9GAMM|nr:phage terminase small subunit [Thiothrix eikelboomii]SKA81202.1 Phage small terminase subunit [Thiothrix eikelboomii]